MTSCNLSFKDSSVAETWAMTLELLARANDAAGVALVSDQALLDAQQRSRELFHIFSAGHDDTEAPLGFVILSDSECDLVIDPANEGNGFGGCALEQILNLTSGDLRIWVHGNQPAATTLLTRQLFRVRRTLLLMHRAATNGDATSDDVTRRAAELPEGYFVEQFRDADADEWVSLNRKVFAGHPEQGSWTRADLDARLRESWHEPEYFLVLRDPVHALIGYCWLKVLDDDAEVYVIGIDPEFAGKSLGSALLDIALERVLTTSTHPIRRISLYVDEENAAAVALYQSRGFTVARTSRQWVLSRR